MSRPVSATRYRFPLALAFSVVGLVLILRYLWSYSLGNTDELFFSTGAGRFAIGEGSWSQWGEFFSWLWLEHTGRTADWLSGAIYFWGASSGRWLASLLTAISAGAITWCLHVLGKHFSAVEPPAFLAAPISLLVLTFSYAVTIPSTLVNLTMYSAAVANYFVPTALIMVALTMTVTVKKLSGVYIAAFLGFVASTMHEQAAAVMAVLTLVFLILNKWPLHHRVISALVVATGVVEMFLAPGLHDKLERTASAASGTPVPMVFRISTTFYSFGVYYWIMGSLISLIMLVVLVNLIREGSTRWSAHVLLFTLAISTTLWVLSFHSKDIPYLFSSRPAIGFFTAVMAASWIVVPLLSNSKTIKFGSVILLAAATSLTIPAAAGLGATRVFNYPIIFLLIFQLWSAFFILPTTHMSSTSLKIGNSLSPWQNLLQITLVLLTIWAITSSVTAFRANYPVGIADLEEQDQQCAQQICPAQKPTLPFPQFHPGYGDHDYANTAVVLEWVKTK